MCARLSASPSTRARCWMGFGVVVCSVVGGKGGVLWYPVRGLMGLGYGGCVLQVCVVSAEVRDLEGR